MDVDAARAAVIDRMRQGIARIDAHGAALESFRVALSVEVVDKADVDDRVCRSRRTLALVVRSSRPPRQVDKGYRGSITCHPLPAGFPRDPGSTRARGPDRSNHLAMGLP